MLYIDLSINPFNHFIRRSMKAVMVAALITSFTGAQVAQACTSFLLHGSDGNFVYGRTMEFAFEMSSDAIVIPRQYELAGTGPDGKQAMKWKSKYAAVGLNAFGLAALLDGVNEKGLAGGILYFAGFAEYASVETADLQKSLASWDFLTWALTNFATVEEVKAAAADIVLTDVKQKDMGITPPLHYTLHDASGASIVIESIGGQLKVHDNPIGTLTNSPPFDWHMNNLRNYVKLTPVNAPPLKLYDVDIKPLGQGSGFLGVPGDSTPPSRFVRASAYAAAVANQKSGMESVRLAEHVLNNFDIPKGYIQQGEDSDIPLEYTQWSSVIDLNSRTYYIKTYYNQILRSISLMDFNLDAKDVLTAKFAPQLEAPALKFPE